MTMEHEVTDPFDIKAMQRLIADTQKEEASKIKEASKTKAEGDLLERAKKALHDLWPPPEIQGPCPDPETTFTSPQFDVTGGWCLRSDLFGLSLRQVDLGGCGLNLIVFWVYDLDGNPVGQEVWDRYTKKEPSAMWVRGFGVS